MSKNAGMIFADKAYSGKGTRNKIKAKGCYDGGVIHKNNQKDKNKDKDRRTTKARQRGLAKVQMQAFMEAICFNLKRAVKIKELADIQGSSLSAC